MWTLAVVAAASVLVAPEHIGTSLGIEHADLEVEIIRVSDSRGCAHPSGAQLDRARGALHNSRTKLLAKRDAIRENQNARLSGLEIVLDVSPEVAANQEFMAAIERAVLRWENLVRSPVRILYQVDFTSGEPFIAAAQSSILGNGPYQDTRSALIARAGVDTIDYISALPLSQFPHIGNGGTNSIPIYGDTRAVRKSLGFSDPGDISVADGIIVFNTDFVFDLDNSDGVTPDTIDLESVMIHEIGHTMGFVSGVDSQFIRTSLDLFRFGIDGESNDPGSLDDISDTSVLRELRIGVEAAIDTVGAVQPFTEPLRLSTGTDGDGRQASHWKDDQLLGLDRPIGVMDPTVPLDRLAPDFFTSADRLAFRLLGWDLSIEGVSPCDADFNQDGVLNFFDISAFLSMFSDNDLGADLTGDGSLDFFDISQLLTFFSQGCP